MLHQAKVSGNGRNILIDSRMLKKDFHQKLGNPAAYFELCEICPLIDDIYKSIDPDCSADYMCSCCMSINNKPLLRLLFGYIVTGNIIMHNEICSYSKQQKVDISQSYVLPGYYAECKPGENFGDLNMICFDLFKDVPGAAEQESNENVLFTYYILAGSDEYYKNEKILMIYKDLIDMEKTVFYFTPGQIAHSPVSCIKTIHYQLTSDLDQYR